MAAHDLWFMPILAVAVLVLTLSIVYFHTGVGAVVGDVLGTMLALLAALTVRVLLLLPRLGPVVPV